MTLSDSESESWRTTLTGELTLLGSSWRTGMGEDLSPEWERSGRTRYLSERGLSLRGGGEALRSESESDTGLRGREAEEEERGAVQLWWTGEDLGLGRAVKPGRGLYLLE